MVSGLLLDTILIEDGVTVIPKDKLPKVLLSSVHMFTRQLETAGFVVVAGAFLMVTADKML
tara:strand:- start:1795 stop:1977 length:183 start_codon:yes stop_codon:yes gene_type:complete